MPANNDIVWLCGDIALAASVSFGGLVAVLSELQRRICEEQQLMDGDTFVQSYALSLAAPGPNTIFLTLLGYKLGDWPGALAASAAWILPTSLWVYLVGRLGASQVGWLKKLRLGLVPVVFALLIASGLKASLVFHQPVAQYALSGVMLGFLLRYPKTNPLYILAACGLLGILLGL